MKYHWIKKQRDSSPDVQNEKNGLGMTDKLIVFFAGWSFDFKPFEFLECSNSDVLILYDYNEIGLAQSLLEEIKDYENKILIAWSMGVYTAYSLRKSLPDFNKKIAINGTPYPVHNEWGIPLKPFLLTLRHAKTGLEGKFYQNIFSSEMDYERYKNTQVERSIDNRAEELKALYERIKIDTETYSHFYDTAIISSDDKIIPTQNQFKFWKNNAEVKTLESGHFPFYNFKSWEEIVEYSTLFLI